MSLVIKSLPAKPANAQNFFGENIAVSNALRDTLDFFRLIRNESSNDGKLFGIIFRGFF